MFTDHQALYLATKDTSFYNVVVSTKLLVSFEESHVPGSRSEDGNKDFLRLFAQKHESARDRRHTCSITIRHRSRTHFPQGYIKASKFCCQRMDE